MRLKILIILIGLFFLSCKKEGYVNLEAALTSDSNYINALEGDPLIINITLDKKLSEPLVLNGRVFSDVDFPVHANDYDQKLEYSTDFGKTWHTNRSGLSVEIPAKSEQVKLRIATKEDTDYEVLYENFDFVLDRAIQHDNLTLTGLPLHFNMGIIDNEVVERSFDNTIMKIKVDDDQSHRVVEVTERLRKPQLKFILDEKKHLEFLQKAIYFTNTYFDSAHDIEQFELFESENIAGYVYNDGYGIENHWAMGLSPIVAYIELDFSEDGPPTIIRKPYNYNGDLAYTLVHEAGHILSLTNGIHVNNTLTDDACGFREEYYGDCFLKDSWVTAFYNKFYNEETREAPIKPEFVTGYASFNITEDIAETLAVYTLLKEQLPPLREDSSTALQKLYFVGQQQEVNPFAEYMIKSAPYFGEITFKKTAKNSPYLFENLFVNRHKGKVIDCQTAGQLSHKKQND